MPDLALAGTGRVVPGQLGGTQAWELKYEEEAKQSAMIAAAEANAPPAEAPAEPTPETREQMINRQWDFRHGVGEWQYPKPTGGI